MADEDPDLDSSAERPEMSWLGEGIVLSHRVLVVALAMSLPILVGYGLDRWTGTKFPAGVLAGSLFGMLGGGWQLRHLLRWLESRNQAGNSPTQRIHVDRSGRNASALNTSDRSDD